MDLGLALDSRALDKEMGDEHPSLENNAEK